jgi:hypothetical protein
MIKYVKYIGHIVLCYVVYDVVCFFFICFIIIIITKLFLNK